MIVKLLKCKSVALIIALCLLYNLFGCSTSFNTEVGIQTSDISGEIATPISLGIEGTLTIAYPDVGQGDSTYIVLPNSETVLIDAGEASTSGDIIKFIKDSNDNGTINYLIATHPHSDHIGGMAAVINAFEVKSI